MTSIRFIGVDEDLPERNATREVNQQDNESTKLVDDKEEEIPVYETIPDELLMMVPTVSKAPEQQYPMGSHVICPYNQQHKLLPSRMYHHLAHCRAEYMKKNPQFSMIRCRYNGRHFVPDQEITFHEQTCNDTLYKRILEESKIEPRPWIIPERKDDKQECLDMQDTLARFQAREYVLRMGAKRTAAEDVSDESGDEMICEYTPRDVTTAVRENEVHSDDSDQAYAEGRDD